MQVRTLARLGRTGCCSQRRCVSDPYHQNQIWVSRLSYIIRIYAIDAVCFCGSQDAGNAKFCSERVCRNVCNGPRSSLAERAEKRRSKGPFRHNTLGYSGDHRRDGSFKIRLWWAQRLRGGSDARGSRMRMPSNAGSTPVGSLADKRLKSRSMWRFVRIARRGFARAIHSRARST